MMIHGIKTHRELQVLKPVLKKWQDLNTYLSSEEDVAWWYNERASLSVFAGALWKCGGWAFEEFSIERRTQSTRRKAQGRCDIQFEFKGHGYIGEAKQTWFSLGKKRPVSIKKVERDLSRAQHEIRQIQVKANHQIAMTFVVPEINISESANLSKHIEEFVQELHKIKNAALAWTFPQFARNMRPDNQYRDYIYPGVALVLIPANSASNKNQ